MNYKCLIFLPIFLSSFSCKEKSIESTDFKCNTEPNKRFFTQNELTLAFRDDVVEGLASSNSANTNGAMGRNKEGYFHVRFQMGISSWANYAIDKQKIEALEIAVKSIEYSFQYQTSIGDFQVVIPPSLATMGTPQDSDVASGIAFFMSSLGSGLLALEESDWFRTQNLLKSRISALQPKFALALQFLKNKQNILRQTDGKAPNRLLFDAVAYYSLGKYLNDSEAMELGITFAKLAIAQQHPDGYYIEGGGWDSSYQAVALENGFRLLTLLKPDEPYRQSLYNSLACGTSWEASRIQDSGEITTKGNARVYEGGETFLGQEKNIAFKSALVALLSTYHYTDNQKYSELANKVLLYYR